MADTKISALTAAASAAGANEFPINEAGTSKKVTGTQIVALAAETLAPIASPTFTGTPAAPTAAADTNTTQVATTAFVLAQAATQAEQETGTSTTKFVTAGRQHFHPSACKCWGKAAGAGTLTTSYNTTSVTDTATGRLGVNIATDFSSADYAIVTSVASVATTLTVATVDNGGLIRNASQAAGVFEIWNYDDTATTHVAQDPQTYFWACFGDHA